MATLYWPFPTSTVSEWPGQRRGSYHVGTDFAVPQGTPLRATIDGVIVRHNNDGLGAYVLDIIADDGLLVRNGHLSRMDVNTGQRVKAGQVIGLTGGRPGTPGAGNSFGPHLHWELRRDRLWNGGNWIDPRKLNPQPSNFGDTPQPSSTEESEKEMYAKIQLKGGWAGIWNMATGEDAWIGNSNDWNQFEKNLKSYYFDSRAEFEAFRDRYPFKLPKASFDTNAVANAIAGNIKLDVDALAAAIANKINASAGADVTTKAEILAAIEANYPDGV